MPSRQPVYGRCGVATSQPLATSHALLTLSRGGNAIDAALTAGSVLSVTEPCSNGLGGDGIALIYLAQSEQVVAIHGVGSAPHALTDETFGKPNGSSMHTVTVPGVVAMWEDMYRRYSSGRVTFEEVLKPAVEIAKEGFAVGRMTARWWKDGEKVLKKGLNGDELLIDGRAPKEGEIFRNEKLGSVLEGIGKEGKAAFYKGGVAESIVKTVKEGGGMMEMEDLKGHKSEMREAIHINWDGGRVYEPGGRTQGGVALVALKLLGGRTGALDMVNAIRTAFDLVLGELREGGSVEALLERMDSADFQAKGKKGGDWGVEGGTVQFCVADKEGNLVSMVQSNFQGFGTGHVVRGCGFSLQNRGLGYLTLGRVGGKPFHTIMPALWIKEDEKVALGVMGGFMQPQGHVQVLMALKQGVQEALDKPRFRVTGRFSSVEGLERECVLVEEGMSQDVVREIKEGGKEVREGKGVFGRGQVLVWRSTGVVGGSDWRADGYAAVL